MSEELLEREMYSVAEAARILDVPYGTLRYWLDGSRRGRRAYPPVIRPTTTGQTTVTWGEFVTLNLLKQFRRVHGVEMIDIRDLIQQLREQMGVTHPLAVANTWTVSGREIIEEIQGSAHTPEPFRLVTKLEGQILLTEPSESFLETVKFDETGAVSQVRPMNDVPLVLIDPDVRFGLPAVSGISTRAVFEHRESGASEKEIATIFGLKVSEVRSAIRYEFALAA